MKLDAFTTAYIVAALWASTDNSTPSGGEPLDANYDITDVAPEALAATVSSGPQIRVIHPCPNQS